jgi:hypothetical protein
MEEVKPWWQSKIIWTQIVGLAFMVLSKVVELPEGITVDQVVTAILAVMSIATIVLRKTATASIGKTDNSVG